MFGEVFGEDFGRLEPAPLLLSTSCAGSSSTTKRRTPATGVDSSASRTSGRTFDAHQSADVRGWTPRLTSSGKKAASDNTNNSNGNSGTPFADISYLNTSLNVDTVCFSVVNDYFIMPLTMVI